MIINGRVERRSLGFRWFSDVFVLVWFGLSINFWEKNRKKYIIIVFKYIYFKFLLLVIVYKF